MFPKYVKKLTQQSLKNYSTQSTILNDTKREAYKIDLLKYGYIYGKAKGQKPVIGKELDRNLKFYDITRALELPIPIGPSKNVWLWDVLQNFGGASEKPFLLALEDSRFSKYVDTTELATLKQLLAKTNVKKMAPEHLETGAVMFELMWNLAINDSFIRGGVDSRQDFTIAAPVNTVSMLDPRILWDEKEKRPTVLGRELFQLSMQGYYDIAHGYPGHSIVLSPPETRNIEPPKFDLEEYLDRLEHSTDQDKFIDELKKTL